ncbi:MAG: hypothetical protein AAF703_02430 [Cyanobacteria bacterium P01_D01_bin.105]
MKRRQFTKSLVLGATASSFTSLIFPKAAEAHSYDYILSDRDVRATLMDLINIIDFLLVSRGGSMYRSAVVNDINSQFASYGYDYGQPIIAAKQSSSAVGRFSNTPVALSPGLGIGQVANSRASTAFFTGPTVIGMQKAAEYLRNQGLSSQSIEDSITPVRSRYRDMATWFGDQGAAIGLDPSVGLSQYDTKLGQVIRRYDAIDPYGSNVGRVSMTIEAANQPRRVITTNITT